MFNIPRGDPITEARLAQAQRQFEFLQRRGAGVPERVKGVAAGQQLGLVKLGKKSPEGHPHKLLLPADTLAQVQVDLMRKQITPRMAGGGYAGLGLGLNPYVEDRSGEMRRQEEHGLRTPYGVSLVANQGLLRTVESPTIQTAPSTITPNPKLEPSLLPF